MPTLVDDIIKNHILEYEPIIHISHSDYQYYQIGEVEIKYLPSIGEVLIYSLKYNKREHLLCSKEDYSLVKNVIKEFIRIDGLNEILK